MRQDDAVAIMEIIERIPMPLYPLTYERLGRMDWKSLSEYARFCAASCEGLATPRFVFEACRELMATT